MKPAGAELFAPASVLLSRAWWLLCDRPLPLLAFGLAGSAPGAALFLLFAREAQETLFVPGATPAVLTPLSFGLAVVLLARFPFRLALAHWLAAALRGADPGVAASLGFALRQLPAALLYGAIATLSWLFGALTALPYVFHFRACLAFHLFASGDTSALAAWRATGQVPLSGIGARLLCVASVLFLVLFLVLWTTPGTALGLAGFLLRANVAPLTPLFAASSPAWLATAVVLTLTVVELLWTLAFGLLAAQWNDFTGGGDLAAALAELERRQAAPEVFA